MKPTPTPVRVIDLDISFTSCVWLTTKMMLAALPALCLAVGVASVLVSVFGGLLSSLGGAQ